MWATRALAILWPAIFSSRKRASASTSGSSGTTRRPEAARPALMIVELVDGDELGLLDTLDHELRDAVADAHVVVRRWVGVDEHNHQLAAIAAVDEPRRVEAGNAVVGGEAAAGQHEAGVTIGNGDADAGTDARPSPAGLERDGLRCGEVGPGVTRVGVAGEG